MSSPRLSLICTVLSLVAVAAATVTVMPLAPARAESMVRPCFAPRVSRAAGDVPANWPLFAVEFPPESAPQLEWTFVRLMRISDATSVSGSTIQQPSRGGFVPGAELVVGEDYDFLAPSCPGEPPLVTRYHAVAPIAEPTSLGTISVSPLYAANPFRGAEVVHFVEVTLAPDASVTVDPWLTALEWVAEIDDGGGHTAFSERALPLTELRSRVIVQCEGGRPAPGTYPFRGAAAPPDRRFTLATPEITATIGDCDTAVRVHDRTLAPLTPDEIIFWDTAAPPGEPDSGCAISGGHPRSAVSWAMAMCVVVALWRARGRR